MSEVEVEATPPEQLSPIVKIGGEEVDVSKALPFTTGDYRKLRREHGFDIFELAQKAKAARRKDGDGGGMPIDIDTIFALAAHAIRKLRPQTTDAEIDALPLDDVSNAAAVVMAGTQQGKVDRPT